MTNEPRVKSVCSRCFSQMFVAQNEKSWCDDCRVDLHAVVFVRRRGGVRAGHVGWAWESHPVYKNTLRAAELNAEFPRAQWYVGAVENWGAWLIQRASRSSYWSTLVEDVFSSGLACEYDACKLIVVTDADPVNAKRVQEEVRKRGYRFLTNNCMNSTFRILSAFGAQLPNPNAFRNWRPNDWFDHIDGQMVVLK